MEDVTSSNIEYTSHNGNELRKPRIVALNIEGVLENMVYNSTRENKQASHARRNAESEASKGLPKTILRY